MSELPIIGDFVLRTELAMPSAVLADDLRGEILRAGAAIHETALPVLERVDVELRESCLEQDPDAGKVCGILEQVAKGVRDAEYIEISNRVEGRGGKVNYCAILVGAYEETRFIDIEFGGITVGEFFQRELSIDEIIAYLTGRGGIRRNYTEVLGGIIPSLLALSLERVLISENMLSESLTIFRNITLFRNWVVDRNNLEAVVGLLPSFEGLEIRELGILFGMYADLDEGGMLSIHELLSKLGGKVNGERDRDKIQLFKDSIKIGFIKINSIEPFGEAVSASALTESTNAPYALTEAYQIVDVEFGRLYDEILNTLMNHKELRIDAGDSLYLRRLGIKAIRFKLVDKLISAEIECSGWYWLDLFIQKPSGREEGWEDLICATERIPRHRVYELGIYLEVVLIDHLRLREVVYSSKKKDDRRLVKSLYPVKKKKGVSFTDALVVARRLFENGGFEDPLAVCSCRLDSRRPIGHLVDGEIRLIRDDESWDYICPATGEIRRDVGREACYYKPLVYDPVKDKSGREYREYIIRLSIELLSIRKNWQLLFRRLGEVSFIGAVEYILLHKL